MMKIAVTAQVYQICGGWGVFEHSSSSSSDHSSNFSPSPGSSRAGVVSDLAPGYLFGDASAVGLRG